MSYNAFAQRVITPRMTLHRCAHIRGETHRMTSTTMNAKKEEEETRGGIRSIKEREMVLAEVLDSPVATLAPPAAQSAEQSSS